MSTYAAFPELHPTRVTIFNRSMWAVQIYKKSNGGALTSTDMYLGEGGATVEVQYAKCHIFRSSAEAAAMKFNERAFAEAEQT